MMIATIPVPEKTVPDYVALASIFEDHGPFMVPASINYGAARACLHRHGLTLRPVYAGGDVAAYEVGKLSRRNTRRK